MHASKPFKTCDMCSQVATSTALYPQPHTLKPQNAEQCASDHQPGVEGSISTHTLGQETLQYGLPALCVLLCCCRCCYCCCCCCRCRSSRNGVHQHGMLRASEVSQQLCRKLKRMGLQTDSSCEGDVDLVGITGGGGGAVSCVIISHPLNHTMSDVIEMHPVRLRVVWGWCVSVLGVGLSVQALPHAGLALCGCGDLGGRVGGGGVKERDVAGRLGRICVQIERRDQHGGIARRPVCKIYDC